MTVLLDLLSIMGALKATLEPLAPSFDDEVGLAEDGIPPRFVWILQGADTRPPMGAGSKTLGTDAWAVEAHCWGEDLTQALGMRAAVVTALRAHVPAGRYTLGRTVPYVGRELGVQGATLTLGFSLRLPLVAIDLAQLPTLVARTRPSALAPSASFAPLPADDGSLTPAP